MPRHQLWSEGTEQPYRECTGCDRADFYDPQGAPEDVADWELYYALGLHDPGEELMPPGALRKPYDHPA